MATEVVSPQEEQVFDPKAHLEQRNAAEAAKRVGQLAPEPKPKEAATEVKPKAEEHVAPGASRRSWARVLKQAGAAEERARVLEEENARLRGATAVATEPKAKAADDPEPQRKDFADDAQYNRALGRWDARQETKAELGKRDQAANTQEQMRQIQELVDSSTAKFSEDIKIFPKDEWEKLQEETEDDDRLNFEGDHNLTMLFATSDVRAAVLFYLAKNPEAMAPIKAAKDNPADQIQKFRRLEGRAEKLYDTYQPAQGTEPVKPAKEDRKHPAEEPANGSGRSKSEELDARKPRPSTEVAARGGSAPPEEPPIGSKAWMANRNLAQFGPNR